MTNQSAMTQLQSAVKRYVDITNDTGMANQAGGVMSTLRSALENAVGVGDTVQVVFPCGALNPEKRMPALLVALSDRYLLMWQKGTIKKTPASVTIFKEDIEKIYIGTLNTGSLKGKRVLHAIAKSGPTEQFLVVISEAAWSARDALLAAM